MAKGQTVLVVDPESDFLEWAVRQLNAAELRVLQATRADEALAIFGRESPDLVIADTHLEPFTGQDLLTRIRERDPNAFVLLVSAYGTTQALIEAMKLGAFDFLRKESLPFNFRVVVDTALKEQRLTRDARASRPQLTVEQHQDSIVGQSEAMQQVFKLIGRVAHSDAPIMITGESGTGKELVARAIHHYSSRSEKSFVAINCAAIPEQLLESELFGHEKGAFTGATGQRIGRFEQSNGGTLLLDEIGDMPLSLQGKILRVLQDGDLSRVGGNEVIKTDVRIIAATNKNLETEVAAKRFREDLFYRLNVVRVQLPPLRQRVEDIRLLAEYFVKRVADEKHLPRLKLSEEAVRVLEGHSWPGNVRELENTIRRACVLATGDILLPKDIPLGAPGTEPAAPAGSIPKEEAIEVLLRYAQSDPSIELLPWLEREFTVHAMRQTRGNQVQAAKLLGITRATLRKRLERFGITRELVVQ
jgi:DNA-binding NtrC family response regulator